MYPFLPQTTEELLTRKDLASRLKIDPRSVDRHYRPCGMRIPGAKGWRWQCEKVLEFIQGCQNGVVALGIRAPKASVHRLRVQNQGRGPGGQGEEAPGGQKTDPRRHGL